jgi:transcriptional regulator with XRE-family HTH domain
MEDLASRPRAARECAGVSLAAMAAHTHYSKSLLGLLETGKRSIRAEHVMAYSTNLRVPLGALYGPAADPLRMAHEWVVADTPAWVHTRSGRRVGQSLVDELERRVVELRLLDDTIGGGDLFPLVSRELDHAQQVADSASYSDQTGRRLFTVVGELSQLAGWVASDAGHYREAQATYLSGVSAAQLAGDDALVGQLLSSLSYQTANVGDPRDAALLARSAVRGACAATVVSRSIRSVSWCSSRGADHSRTVW